MLKYIKSKLNTLEEMCTNEMARHRNNTILFTLLISAFYFALLVSGFVVKSPNFIIVSAVFMAVSLTLFFAQATRKNYVPAVARLFGVLALVMSAYFLGIGNMENNAYLWLVIVPLVGVMVVPFWESVIFNAAFLALVIIFLAPPVYNLLPCEYSIMLRIAFPFCIIIITLCAFVVEIIRSRTQNLLMDTAAELKTFAFTDPLTGAYNRHAILSHFGDYDRAAYGLSFGIADLDHFKAVNDTHGHLVGDKALCHLVTLMRECIPPNALLYRWGGEEFLIVLKTADTDETGRILDQIRKKLNKTPLEDGGRNIPLSISIGAVCGKKGDTIHHCIHQADENLYRAKEGGRNRVVMEDDN